MKKRAVSILLLLFFSIISFSQTQSEYIVKGTVVDSLLNEAIPYCTISASSLKSPSEYVKRVAADLNGNFKFVFKTNETRLLKFESVGMNPIIKKVEFVTKNIDLGKVLLSDNKTLSEVTITATKPLVKVDLDKIVYDIKADPDAQTFNLLEMLDKVPMLNVDAEDKITLRGKSNFKIFMNGKPTNIITNNPSQVLKSIPANTIKNIEVITEPGAKYEAEGIGGIINIVTDKVVSGYSASLNTELNINGTLSGGVYYSTKKGKLGITTNLNAVHFENPRNYPYYFRLNKTDNSELIQNSTAKSNGNYQYGNMSISYEIDSLDLITLNGSGFGGNQKNNRQTNSVKTDEDENILQSYYQNLDTKYEFGGYEASLDYQHSYMKPDKLLTFSYHISYSPFDNDSHTVIDTLTAVNYSSPEKRIKTNTKGTEHTFQVDYTEPFNKKHVVEIGAKYIIRNNNSINTYRKYDETLHEWTSISETPDNDFCHHQDVLGTYVSYTYKTKKFSARAGARYEYTKSSIEYKNQSEKNFSPPSFRNLVPSLNFNYKISDISNVQLSYTQRLSRPDIYYLNPFINNTDPYNISVGNPKLDTEISNSFSINYGYFNKKLNVNTSLYYSSTDNSIESITSLSGDTLITTYKNIGANRDAGLSAYFRWQITPKLNLRFNGFGDYVYLSDGNGTQNDGFNYRGQFGGGYDFYKDWRFSFYLGMTKRGLSLQGNRKSNGFYGVSFSKSFLEKKLSFTFKSSMFCQKYTKYKSYSETETYRTENIYKAYVPSFRLGVSYRFGEMKAKIKTTKRTINNDDLKGGGGAETSSGSGGEN